MSLWNVQHRDGAKIRARFPLFWNLKIKNGANFVLFSIKKKNFLCLKRLAHAWHKLYFRGPAEEKHPWWKPEWWWPITTTHPSRHLLWLHCICNFAWRACHHPSEFALIHLLVITIWSAPWTCNPGLRHRTVSSLSSTSSERCRVWPWQHAWH